MFFFFLFPGLSPSYCGTLPFAFISWLAYSVYLVGKIAVIFTSQIPAFMANIDGEYDRSKVTVYYTRGFLITRVFVLAGNMTGDPVSSLGSNLLKVTIGLSALVFIIMLQVRIILQACKLYLIITLNPFQAHHNHESTSPHSGYISGVCHNTAVEVFDSVGRNILFFVLRSCILSCAFKFLSPSR